MEEGVGPPPRADCDRSWVNMEGAQTDKGEGVGPPLRVGCDLSLVNMHRPITGRELVLPSGSAVTNRGPP